MMPAEGLTSRLRSAIDAQLHDAADIRHRIHQSPDLGGQEDRTATMVAEALGMPDAPRVTEGRLIRVGTGDGSAVGIRAELDGLPLVETSTAPWRSTNGAAHACGHDVHVAALVAFARALAAVEGPRPIVAVLQPREETYPCGAKDMIESPLLAAQKIGAFLGVHLQPTLEEGVVAAQEGPVNAASDEFQVIVAGRAGHAAYPHLGRDPIVAGSAVVLALQHLVSRRMSPMHPAVLTVATMNGGTAANAIPEKVVLTGMLRTFDEADRDELHKLIADTSEHTALAHGCTASITLTRGEPVLVNDDALANKMRPWLHQLGLRADGNLRSCGSDDFAYYGTMYPSLMAFVGVGSPGDPGLHHPAFLPPDDAIRDVAYSMLAGYLAACEVLDAIEVHVPLSIDSQQGVIINP